MSAGNNNNPASSSLFSFSSSSSSPWPTAQPPQQPPQPQPYQDFQNLHYQPPQQPASHHKLPAGPRGDWTPEQDESLRLAVSAQGGKNWKKIALEIPGDKTHVQCLQRWNKVIKPGLIKGPWKPQEDELLRQTAEEIAKNNWVAVSERVPGRTPKQCRERWLLCLDPKIRKEKWTDQEDAQLLQLHSEHGNAWAFLAKQLEGRTENAIKSRMKSLQKRMYRNWSGGGGDSQQQQSKKKNASAAAAAAASAAPQMMASFVPPPAALFPPLTASSSTSPLMTPPRYQQQQQFQHHLQQWPPTTATALPPWQHQQHQQQQPQPVPAPVWDGPDVLVGLHPGASSSAAAPALFHQQQQQPVQPQQLGRGAGSAAAVGGSGGSGMWGDEDENTSSKHHHLHHHHLHPQAVVAPTRSSSSTGLMNADDFANLF